MNPDKTALLQLLKQYFGFGSFRPLQEEIIQDALAGRDVFALLPTGGGKSLCFQLPALAQAGLTYTLLVDVGFRKDFSDPGSVALIVGSNTVLATGVAAQGSGNWVTYTATYTAIGTDAGTPITISLSSPGAQGDWDNVRLSNSAISVPEPASLLLLGAGFAGLGAIRRRRA